MFRHYLITRFNLRKQDWEVTKNNEKLLTETWLEDRFWLFENFCLPSVAGQSNKNFQWLLYFDTTTPSEYRKRIEELVQPFSFIKLFYVDGMEAFYPGIKKYVNAHAAQIPYIITSRIDNDDAIHRDFIDEIQKQFHQQRYRVIDCIKGYSLQVSPAVMLGKKEHIFNPFISLIERNENPQTIWYNYHTAWKKERRITYITHRRLWIAVIHEKNKVNNFNGYGNVPLEKIKNDFSLPASIYKYLEENNIPHKKWVKTSLKNAWIVKYKVLSKRLKKGLRVYRFK